MKITNNIKMKKNTVRSVVFRLCMAALLAMAPAAHAQQLEPLPVPAVSTDTLMKHIVELASDSYQGRLSGLVGTSAPWPTWSACWKATA